jgi:hypothetical protein
MVLKNDSSIPNEARAKAARANGKMKQKVYEKELHKLQVELCRLQDWVKETGDRMIILLEGRDAAGIHSIPRRAASWSCGAAKPSTTWSRSARSALGQPDIASAAPGMQRGAGQRKAPRQESPAGPSS